MANSLAMTVKTVPTKQCLDNEGHTVISDRDKGIPAALQQKTNKASLRACTQHIIGNAKAQAGSKNSDWHPNQVYEIQQCKTEAEADAKLKLLGKKSPVVEAYLRNIDPALWLLWPVITTRALRANGQQKATDLRTSNYVESTNSVLLGARAESPLAGAVTVSTIVMKQTQQRRAKALRRLAKGEPLTEFAQSQYDAQPLQSQHYKVTKSTCAVAYVKRSSGMIGTAKTHCVDLTHSTCTLCSYWMQMKIPCRHAIATQKPDLAGPISRPLVNHPETG
jgi:hypothetical protein